MRKGVLFAAFLVLALAIISTVFSILTATSPRWAVQKYYRGMLDKTTFTTVICAAHRSPFYRCGLPRVAGDSPCEIPSCRFYPPSGRNRTSCRVDAEVGAGFLRTATLNGTLGTYMECQEVHMAGNLQIAATVFTGFGLLVSFAFLVTLFLPHHQRTAGESREAKSHAGSTAATALAILTPLLVLSLVIGAVLQVLAQFFGVLGLTLNATQNARDVISKAPGGFRNFGASDWVLDIALVRYASVAWLSAVLCAVGACWLYWRTQEVRSRG